MMETIRHMKKQKKLQKIFNIICFLAIIIFGMLVFNYSIYFFINLYLFFVIYFIIYVIFLSNAKYNLNSFFVINSLLIFKLLYFLLLIVALKVLFVSEDNVYSLILNEIVYLYIFFFLTIIFNIIYILDLFFKKDK